MRGSVSSFGDETYVLEQSIMYPGVLEYTMTSLCQYEPADVL